MHVKKLMPQPVMFPPTVPQPGVGPEELGARQQDLLNRMKRLRQAAEARRQDKNKKRRSRRDVADDVPENDFEQALFDAYDRLERG